MATNKAGSSLYSYTVAPHLVGEYDVPISEFAHAHHQYLLFIVAGFVFTNRAYAHQLPKSASEYAKKKKKSIPASKEGPNATTTTNNMHERPTNEPLMLIIQRSPNDSFGGYWDFPGGSLEPHDQTLLDGVAREVLEETGLHVSKIRDLVRIDTWNASRSRYLPVAKFSFVVDVHEAVDTDGWEEKIRLAPDEHVNWLWATYEEIEESARHSESKSNSNSNYVEGKRTPPYAFVGVQGQTAWEAFKTYLRLENRLSSETVSTAGIESGNL